MIEYESDIVRAQEGDILIAKRNYSTGEGLYREEVLTEGKEYACLGIYDTSIPCVYIIDDCKYHLGLRQEHFRIKKRSFGNYMITKNEL
jgi:hypothetical protein